MDHGIAAYRPVMLGEYGGNNMYNHPYNGQLMETVPALPPRRRNRDWLISATPLLLHLLASCSVVAFVLVYVDHGTFSYYSDARRYPIDQADGSQMLTPFHLLQADVTTILAALITVVRVLASMWCTAMAWRCIFILMQKTGVSLMEISRVLSWRLLFSLKSRGTIGALISVMLLVSFPYQFSGPILTGSITWMPVNAYTFSPVGLPNITYSAPGDGWNAYSRTPDSPTLIYQGSALAVVAYQYDYYPTVQRKRVVHGSQYLVAGTVISNITIPYFEITSFEWIRDPERELRAADRARISQESPWNPWLSGTAKAHVFSLLPDAWGSPNSGRGFPEATIISETRILAGVYAIIYGDNPSSCSDGIIDNFSPHAYRDFPRDIQTVMEIPIGTSSVGITRGCFVFARVSYVAGAADCPLCTFEYGLVVSNASTLNPKADPMTAETMALMPLVAAEMERQLVAVPLPSSFSYRDYAAESLQRAYTSTWSSLTFNIGSLNEDPGLTTRAWIASPATQAEVRLWRVYLWFGLNIMVTISGVAFMIIQFNSDQPISVQPAMTALLLDAGQILPYGSDPFQSAKSLSKLATGDMKLGASGRLEVAKHLYPRF
jgi:hypothetical protein